MADTQRLWDIVDETYRISWVMHLWAPWRLSLGRMKACA